MSFRICHLQEYYITTKHFINNDYCGDQCVIGILLNMFRVFSFCLNCQIRMTRMTLFLSILLCLSLIPDYYAIHFGLTMISATKP